MIPREGSKIAHRRGVCSTGVNSSLSTSWATHGMKATSSHGMVIALLCGCTTLVGSIAFRRSTCTKISGCLRVPIQRSLHAEASMHARRSRQFQDFQHFRRCTLYSRRDTKGVISEVRVQQNSDTVQESVPHLPISVPATTQQHEASLAPTLRLKRDVAVLLWEHLGRFIAQELQVLAEHPPCQSRVDNVIHEPTASCHLPSAKTN